MQITIEITVTDSEWPKQSPNVKREIKLDIATDYEHLFEHVAFGEIIPNQIADAIDEYAKALPSNPEGGPQ